MTAYIIDAKGKETRLPPILSWEFDYADSEACGGFEVKFLHDADLKEALHAACAFRAVHRDETVFSGIIDEVSVTAGPVGITVTVAGRSREAELMDNECEAAAYSKITLDTLKKNYASAFTKATVKLGSAVTLKNFEVASGQSAWSALCRFMTLAGRTRPVFSPDGVLYLGTEMPKKTVVLLSSSIDRCEERDRRYGMASKYLVVNRVKKRRFEAADKDFTARGGNSRKVLSVDRSTSLANIKLIAADRLSALNQNRHTVTVRTPYLFAAYPGDTVKLSEPTLGISGSFRVSDVRVFADEYQSYTEICAEVKG